MDLRLRCVTPAATFDVALAVEPGHRLADVRRAVVGHAASLGVEVDGDARMVVHGRIADPDATVFATGLATGDDLELGFADPVDDVGAFAVRVSVVSGPDAGAIELLGPGRHVIGRDATVGVPLTDPTVAAAHVHLDVRDDGALRVVPVDTTCAVSVDDVEVVAATELDVGSILRLGGSVVEVALVRRSTPTDALGTVAHNRTPYRRAVANARELAPLATAPNVPDKPRFVLASALLPVASGGMLVAISGRIQFLFLVLLSPLLMGWTYLQDRRSGRREHERDRVDYLASIDQRLERGGAALADEETERRRAAPPLDVLASHARFLQSRLWERDRQTPDFGDLRVGRSSQPSLVAVDVPTGGDEGLTATARDRLATLGSIHDIPVSGSFETDPVMAVVGEADARHAVARALLTRAAVLHSPEDLVIAALVSATSLAEYEWLKWLPHVRSASSPIPGSALAMWPDERDRLVVELANLVEARAEGDAWPKVLVLIDEAVDPDRTVLTRVLDGAAAAGIWVVWCGETAAGVPRQADAVLQCGHGDNPSVLDWRDPARKAIEIDPDRATVAAALEVARDLAPVRDASSAAQVAALPRFVPLFDVLPGGRPTAESIEAEWSRATEGLAAAVGLGPDGPHPLDLVDQGPHALVAGTSGAGKSEFLQSWVAALAARHSPQRLNLLFIDYKGGAFSSAFADLPHNVGAVTNLDATLSLRALTSLRAELDRRMEVLGGDAKDIVELQRLDPDRAPARLVIVVDEFATLVKEIPDFVAGMVDIAQRGRSLGIHLVLATQRPTGSVNDNILANTNLRVSLRVLETADSNSVIGAPDAALLPAPLVGRAFARTGPGQLHPFQSAYSGAPDLAASGPGEITTGSFDFSGVLASNTTSPVSTDAPTQLTAVVQAAAEAHRRSQRPLPPQPWLDPLPDLLTLDDLHLSTASLDARRIDPGRRVAVGLADRPERQRQDPWVVDLEASGGLLVFGAGGAGRTTALRSIAADLAAQAAGRPDEDRIVVHGIDAASRALGAIGVLPVVAGVLTLDDLEPIARLVQVLEREVDERRVLLADADADSLSTLRRMRGRSVVPRIVVLVDGLPAFRETLDTPDAYEWFNRFVRVITDGRQLGIHLVATSERRAGLPATLVGALGSRLVLRMDPEEAMGLGVPRAIASRPEVPAGRGFADGTEVQVAVVGSDHDGPAQAAELARLAEAGPGVAARPLPSLPVRLDRPMAVVDGLILDVGDRDLAAGPAIVDLAAGHLVVTGPAGSGRSSFLQAVASALDTAPTRPRLIGVGAPSSPLASVAGLDERAFARQGHAEVLEAAAAMVDPDGRSVEAVVFVDTIEDVAGPDTDRALERLVSLPSVRLVIVADPSTLSRAFSGWLADVKRHRRAVLLAPEGKAEIDAVLGVRVPLRPGQAFPVGRALLAHRRTVELVQLSHPPVIDET